MEALEINAELLRSLARHQAWADTVHWKALHENSTLLEDPEIRKRLNHMVAAGRMLTGLVQGEPPDLSSLQGGDLGDQLEAAMEKANAGLMEAINVVDLQRMIALPRGPKGPWEAPAGVLLMQAVTHSQYHRGQNAARMRQLGVTPPMTDFVVWYALGQP